MGAGGIPTGHRHRRGRPIDAYGQLLEAHLVLALAGAGVERRFFLERNGHVSCGWRSDERGCMCVWGGVYACVGGKRGPECIWSECVWMCVCTDVYGCVRVYGCMC